MKSAYIDFVSRPSSLFGVMQARIPGRTAKTIWMTQIQKIAPMSPLIFHSYSSYVVNLDRKDDYL